MYMPFMKSFARPNNQHSFIYAAGKQWWMKQEKELWS
jgi:hypothetical protein